MQRLGQWPTGNEVCSEGVGRSDQAGIRGVEVSITWRKFMRKMVGLFGVLALALTVCSAANAQTQVSLGPTANGSIAFVGNSGNVSINLGSCSAGTCTLQGLSAILPPLPAGPDSYKIVQTGAISLASNGAVTQANPISFSYNSGTGLTLTGTLQLVNFIQAGASGLFNDNLMANLSN